MKIGAFSVIFFLLAQSVFADTTASIEEGAVLDLVKVFQGSPVIYSTLLLMSIFAFVLWLYSLLTLRLADMMPHGFITQLRELIAEKKYNEALEACKQDRNFSASILASGIAARKHGSQVLIEAMQSEGRRRGMALWQRISLLNDIAMISPMFGLLGTVLGMFYAFYDSNQSPESIASIFDGLGIAIGTTVAGLIVAILATIFHTTLKFRVVKLLNIIEDEALGLGNLIELEPIVN